MVSIYYELPSLQTVTEVFNSRINRKEISVIRTVPLLGRAKLVKKAKSCEEHLTQLRNRH